MYATTAERVPAGKAEVKAAAVRLAPYVAGPSLAQQTLSQRFVAAAKRELPLTTADDAWIVWRGTELNSGDRVTLAAVERQGNTFTIRATETIWMGGYDKNVPSCPCLGANLGKLPPGKYEVEWVVTVTANYPADQLPVPATPAPPKVTPGLRLQFEVVLADR